VIVEEAGSKKAIRVPKGTQASLLGLAGDLKGSTTSLASKGRAVAVAEAAEAETNLPRFVKPKRKDFFIEEPITALPGDSPPRGGGVGHVGGGWDVKKSEAEEIMATNVAGEDAENHSKAAEEQAAEEQAAEEQATEEQQQTAEEQAGGRDQRDSHVASDEADSTQAAQQGEGGDGGDAATQDVTPPAAQVATGAAADTQAADTFDETNAEIEEEEVPTAEFADLAGKVARNKNREGVRRERRLLKGKTALDRAPWHWCVGAVLRTLVVELRKKSDAS
jgi:hypothetical protein